MNQVETLPFKIFFYIKIKFQINQSLKRYFKSIALVNHKKYSHSRNHHFKARNSKGGFIYKIRITNNELE
jgi:hypothetical protein